MAISTALTRPLQLLTRFMQWSSAVIVMGIVSYLINKGPRGQHLIFQEVIAVLSVAFFLPAFISPFLPKALSKFVLAIDLIFSYLWLTAFIFAAQDYNWHNCRTHAPPGRGCAIKKASESFIFLAFIFTFFGLLLEVLSLWAYRRSSGGAEKNGGARTGEGA
ncbi:membrane-associating domain-containing protein [Thermoascus aurantiacus ATCC 26904]